MGVIDLNARVRALEKLDRGYYPETIDQIESAITALENAVTGEGGLADDVETLQTAVASLQDGEKWQRVYFNQVLENDVTANTSLGSTYFEYSDNIVHMHIGVDNVPANTLTQIFTIPDAYSAYRPAKVIFATGWGGASTDYNFAQIQLLSNGKLSVKSDKTTIRADFVYTVGTFKIDQTITPEAPATP